MTGLASVLALAPAALGRPLEVLCLGAHADDIEIGCGGTLLALAERSPAARVHWVVLSAQGDREQEALASADRFLGRAVRGCVRLAAFQDGYFPHRGAEVKDFFEKLKTEMDPDLVFTHCRSDLHQDHRLVSELTWNTFRNHAIFEYEIPKYDGDLGNPNLFVALDRALCQRKVAYLMEAYGSQRDRHWFSEETFLALLRLRGVESRSPTGYAEAFHARKLCLQLGATS